jgi:hypothetical protein
MADGRKTVERTGGEVPPAERKTPQQWAADRGLLIVDNLDGALCWGPVAGAARALHGWEFDGHPTKPDLLLTEADFLAALDAPANCDRRGVPRPHESALAAKG